MIWNIIALAVTGILAYWLGVTMAGMASANQISELEDEIHKSIPIADVKHYLNSAVLPKHVQNSTAWNAALLDVEKWLEFWE